ncbi:MAG: hypothetical protein OXI30_00555 [Chloroflexota bacterium]|nr:hypothetical protein [Chloroflexota bacterium]
MAETNDNRQPISIDWFFDELGITPGDYRYNEDGILDFSATLGSSNSNPDFMYAYLLGVSRLREDANTQFEHINGRFDNVDRQLIAIKGKINELVDAVNEEGLRGKKVLSFPEPLSVAEEE